MSLHKTVSIKQAAELIGISYGIARDLADSGKLVTVKVGHRFKVHLSEVERFRMYGNFDPKVNYDNLPKPTTPTEIPSREANITLPKDEHMLTVKSGHVKHVTQEPVTRPASTPLDPVEAADKHLNYPSWIKSIPKRS